MKKSKKDSGKRNRIIAGAVLTFLMVSSVILGGFFGFGGAQDKKVLRLNNGKYVFEIKQNSYGSYYYEATKDDETFNAYSLPGEYKPKATPGALDQIRAYPNLFVTFDPDDEGIAVIEQIRYDMSRNLPNGKILIDSVVKESPDYNLQVIDCYDAQIPVIFLRSGNTTEIVNNGSSCIEVYFSQDAAEIRAIRDTLVFSLWGIEV